MQAAAAAQAVAAPQTAAPAQAAVAAQAAAQVAAAQLIVAQAAAVQAAIAQLVASQAIAAQALQHMQPVLAWPMQPVAARPLHDGGPPAGPTQVARPTQPQRAATLVQPPHDPSAPIWPTHAASAAHAQAPERAPSSFRSHANVVEERVALGICFPPGFPIDVALDPHHEGDRGAAVIAAVTIVRERADAAAQSAGFGLRQQEKRPALTKGGAHAQKRGALWRWVCTCAGLARTSKAVLDARADGTDTRKRRNRPSHRTNCPFTAYFEETDSHIAQRGTALCEMTVHNHALRPTATPASDTVGATVGPRADGAHALVQTSAQALVAMPMLMADATVANGKRQPVSSDDDEEDSERRPKAQVC